jgi:plasmid maintenance system antidote protein VapI
MEIERINIGELIKNELANRGISFSSFAKSIGVQRQNIEKTIFSKMSIDTEMLSLISERLDYNFFLLYKDLSECNKKDDTSNEIKEVKAFVTLQIGKEKKEETFTFFFGKDKT